MRIATGTAMVLLAGMTMGVSTLAEAQSTNGGAAPSGVWLLTRIGGEELPAMVEVDGGCREEVTVAVLTFEANNAWHLEWTEREICGDKVDEESESETGVFTFSGNNVELLDGRGMTQQEDSGDDLDDLSTGTLAGNTLTLRLGKTDRTATFRKR